MSLKMKLEMLGYRQDEIESIVSGKTSRDDIDRRIRSRMLCLDTKPSLLKPASPNKGNIPPGYCNTVQPEQKAGRLIASVSEPDAMNSTKRTHQIQYPEERDHGGLSSTFRRPAAKRSYLPEKEQKYLPIIQKIARQKRMEESLIMAVIKVESNFNPRAVSSKGAVGLMQLAPATAVSMGVGDPFDPEENIHGGTEYLSKCIDTFQDMELALAAYNAGPGVVEQLMEVPPYSETRAFIKNVFYYRAIYAHLLTHPL